MYNNSESIILSQKVGLTLLNMEAYLLYLDLDLKVSINGLGDFGE